MIEFALVLPIFLSLMLGMFEIGATFYNMTLIANASREAARIAVNKTTGSCTTMASFDLITYWDPSPPGVGFINVVATNTPILRLINTPAAANSPGTVEARVEYTSQRWLLGLVTNGKTMTASTTMECQF